MATGVVVLAFGIPLIMLATRPPTQPDPMDAVRVRSHAVSALLAATTDAKAVQRGLTAHAANASDPAAAAPDRVAVYGLKGGTVGVAHADPKQLAAVLAATPIGPTTVPVPGGMSYLEPVDLGKGAIAVVEVFIPERELLAAQPASSGAGPWWWLLAAAAVAVFATVLTADRLIVRVSQAARSLAAAARALGDADTATRVAVAGPREVAEAAYAFNAMADRVAEQRAAERELIADLSHRLRTPLTALRLEAERVRTLAADTRLSQAVAAMEREVDHLINTARRQAPAPAVEPELCDASEVVRERMAFWSAVAEDQSRPYTVSGTERRAPVLLPRAELAAALDALLGNVFRYTPQGTAFEVAITRRGGVVAVRVDDAGPGIARPNRALRRGTSEQGSTGLGLDIVRRAAVAGRGGVDVDRAALGGASVVMLLADAEPPAQPVRQRLGFVGRLSREPDEGRWGRRARAVRADRPTAQPTAGATDQP